MRTFTISYRTMTNIGSCIASQNRNHHHAQDKTKNMGRHTRLNQAGITIFETSIIVLILVLLTVSTILMIKKIEQSSKKGSNTVQDANNMTGGHN